MYHGNNINVNLIYSNNYFNDINKRNIATVSPLEDANWVCDLAFWNDLNSKLKGERQLS